MSAMTSSMIAFSMQICICALLVIASPPVAWARFSTIVADSAELAHLPVDRAGSRGLLQSGVVNQSICTVSLGPFDFSKVDYSSVTSVCKGPTYDTNACCGPFDKLACNYKPQINDFNSLCPIYFMSYLNVAGGYPGGVFVGEGRCNSGSNICSS